MRLREARLKHLGLAPFAKYADPVMIADEIEWCSGVLKQNPRWRILDISDKAIEEAAAIVVSAYQSGKKPF